MKTTRGIQVLAASAALAVAVSAASGCAAQRSMGTRIDDTSITAKVKAKIAADPQTNPFEVDVDTTNGVVRLSGTVESDADRDEMERLAESTRGVKKVINSIEIGDPTLRENLTDGAIVAAIKTKLTAHPDVNPFNIDVDVVRGVVTLTGEVDDDHSRSAAEKVARRTKGVQDVVNRIKVSDQS